MPPAVGMGSPSIPGIAEAVGGGEGLCGLGYLVWVGAVGRRSRGNHTTQQVVRASRAEAAGQPAEPQRVSHLCGPVDRDRSLRGLEGALPEKLGLGGVACVAELRRLRGLSFIHGSRPSILQAAWVARTAVDLRLQCGSGGGAVPLGYRGGGGGRGVPRRFLGRQPEEVSGGGIAGRRR